MAFKNANVTVGTDPTRISPADHFGDGKADLAIKVPSGGQTVFVGPSDVTDATGYPIAPGESFYLTGMDRTERLYAVVSQDTQFIYVMAAGV